MCAAQTSASAVDPPAAGALPRIRRLESRDTGAIQPGSAKGVMFITIEDETGVANVVVWPKLFEKRRRVVLGASMMAINGRVQREGDVVHLVAQQLLDLSGDLSGLADRDIDFKLPTGRGDEFAHSGAGGGDARDRPKPIPQAREIYVRDLHIDTLKVKARNFH